MLNAIKTLSRGIVVPLFKPRNPFFTRLLPDDPFYVKPIHKRLPQWDDPNYIWPPRTVAPTRITGKTLIQLLEKEEIERVQSNKKFDVPVFKAGDLIEVTRFKSISKSKFTTNRGMVLGVFKKHTINSAFQYIFNLKGRKVCLNHKMYSPLMVNIKVIQQGSSNVKPKQRHMMSPLVKATDVEKPMLIGKDKAANKSGKKQKAIKIIPKDD